MKKIFILSLVILLLINVVNAQSESAIVKVTLLNQDPDPARAAETVEVRFRVENVGGKQAENVELEIIPEYPFSLVQGYEPTQNIGTLYAYQTEKNSLTVKYKLKIDKDAVKGQHVLKLRYRHDNQAWVTISFNIDVTSKEFAQIIYVDKSKLDPGKETEMKFTITNIGNAPLQNMVFSWSEANGIVLPVYSDDTKYIKYLDVGESADLEYTVVADVNAQSGLYQLDLNLKFEAENRTSKEINTKAGVFVGGETDFDVTFSESSAGQTSLSVANTGNNPALSVTVRIPEQQNFRVTGSTSSIIGNLDKGDYTIVSFQITQTSSMLEGTETIDRSKIRQLSEEERQKLREEFSQRNDSGNNLKVLIEYTDTTGVRHTVEKTVPIQFRSIGTEEGVQGRASFRQKQSIWNSKVIIPTIILVLIIGGFFYYKKRESVNVFLTKFLRKKKK